SNAIILGALRPVSAEVNGYRALLPHVAYRYPPPQTRALHGETLPRLDGADVTASALQEAALDTLASYDAPPLLAPESAGKAGKSTKRAKARRDTPTVAGLLAAQVSGFSRELGREVSVRALGTPDALLRSDFTVEQWSLVAHETRDLAALLTMRAWEPTLVYAPSVAPEAGAPLAFAPFRPRQYPPEMSLRPAASMNAALDAYFEDAEWQNALEGAKGDLRHLLQTQRDRCLRKAEALRSELATLAEAHRLRLEADILLTYQTEIAPGQQSFAIADPFGASEAHEAHHAPITITLDPRLTAVENANRRYARYHKLQRAGEQIPTQLEANEIELARIEQLQTDLALAETTAEVAQVRAEVAEAGYIRGGAEAQRLAKEQRKAGGKKNKPGAKGGKSGQGARARMLAGGMPLRRRLAGEMIALVGKNSRQNETITFHEAAANDLWLHARGVPGAHVILKTGGRPAPAEALNASAGLAAYYSQARLAASVPVDYTEQRYVRHMKGGGPGMVIYERERTLHSAPADAGEPVT
ncbi:MAG TPA: NFACT RNA binding domain-containing protein, partial [Ktedonobacterales bacterium]|nr:NFACT RNA binding domain-containing protein [Ktedonobacterales bacterium]